jgi:diguanylate cyclase (GGDEF)-like protein
VAYHERQRLNEWDAMLHSIYGLSKNYARSQFELLAHLAEVSGAFGKFLFKLKQPDRAKEFLPKMFGWALALARKVEGEKANLEEILLTKYPTVCPYCTAAPCECVPGQKRPIDEAKVRAAFYGPAQSQRRSLNDFQAMFRKIYERSWGLVDVEPGSAEAYSAFQKIYTRMIEEVSEVSEAVRFAHLYPSNFDNELADYLAWLFALVSSIHRIDGGAAILIEDMFWPAYPGICMVCMLDICDCRPSPVRELLSKPSLRELEFVDDLTHANNRTRFERDINAIAEGHLPLPPPIACVQIDLDNFKSFNSPPFNHSIGDAALKHLVTIVQQKVHNRDRLYRVGGDEFALICPDLSMPEAEGMMARVAAALKQKLVPGIGTNGTKPHGITLSTGITECLDPHLIREAFKTADRLAIESKSLGRDRITVASMGTPA